MPKKSQRTARGKVTGSKRGSARTARTTRSTGSTMPRRGEGGGGYALMAERMSGLSHTESLRLSLCALERVSSSLEGMDTSTALILMRTIEFCPWMIAALASILGVSETAVSGLIYGIEQNTAPSPSGSKKRGSL